MVGLTLEMRGRGLMMGGDRLRDPERRPWWWLEAKVVGFEDEKSVFVPAPLIEGLRRWRFGGALVFEQPECRWAISCWGESFWTASGEPLDGKGPLHAKPGGRSAATIIQPAEPGAGAPTYGRGLRAINRAAYRGAGPAPWPVPPQRAWAKCGC